MKIQRLWAVARKESLHIARDPRALWISVALPLLLILLFGYALTTDVDHVPIVVWDQSDSPQTRDLISRFGDSPYFTVKGHVKNYDAIETMIDRGDALMALIVPVDFAQRLKSGQATQVQIIADGSDSNTASIATSYAEAIIQKYSQEIRVALVQTSGRMPAAPLDVRPRVWFNTDMESKNFIIPGLIAVIMMLIAALLTSLTVAKEWEMGTMEQLISTPVRGRELILGKLAPYFVIGMLDMILAVLAGRYLFGVPLRGSVLLLGAFTAIYLLGSLSLGMLISIVSKSQLLANQLALMTTFLPAFLLSGFMFDISNMPRTLQFVTYLVPARYCVSMLRGLYLKGVGMSVLWSEGAFLLVFALVTMAIALTSFKKRLG